MNAMNTMDMHHECHLLASNAMNMQVRGPEARALVKRALQAALTSPAGKAQLGYPAMLKLLEGYVISGQPLPGILKLLVSRVGVSTAWHSMHCVSGCMHAHSSLCVVMSTARHDKHVCCTKLAFLEGSWCGQTASHSTAQPTCASQTMSAQIRRCSMHVAMFICHTL
jgi:hypothetical protein